MIRRWLIKIGAGAFAVMAAALQFSRRRSAKLAAEREALRRELLIEKQRQKQAAAIREARREAQETAKEVHREQEEAKAAGRRPELFGDPRLREPARRPTDKT